MDDPRRDSSYLNGFHQIQKVLAQYRTLTGTSVTIDPDSIYISDHGSPVLSTLKLTKDIEAQSRKIKEVKTFVKRLEQKIDRTREQLELEDTPWVEIRDIKDLLEELLSTAIDQQKPPTQAPPCFLQKKGSSPRVVKSQPDDRCHRCRQQGHKSEDCRSGPPSKPCPRCNKIHWMYDCAVKP